MRVSLLAVHELAVTRIRELPHERLRGSSGKAAVDHDSGNMMTIPRGEISGRT